VPVTLHAVSGVGPLIVLVPPPPSKLTATLPSEPMTRTDASPLPPVTTTLVTSAPGRLVEVPSTVTTTWSPTTATVTSWLPPSGIGAAPLPTGATGRAGGVWVVRR